MGRTGRRGDEEEAQEDGAEGVFKAAAQLSLVRRAMRWAWLLIGAGCLLWCMLITTN
jgi:hypothetical protein